MNMKCLLWLPQSSALWPELRAHFGCCMPIPSPTQAGLRPSPHHEQATNMREDLIAPSLIEQHCLQTANIHAFRWHLLLYVQVTRWQTEAAAWAIASHTGY